MCQRKLLSFLLLLLLFLLPVWSQETGQSQGQAFLVPSPNSSSIENQLPPLPQVQSNMSQTLLERQTAMLEAWIQWYKQVEVSWNNLKSSYENLKSSQQELLNENALLKQQYDLQKASILMSKVSFGAGGFIAGFAAGYLVHGGK